ncbi:DEKNAAC102843 [Brettanomyces naardenensis]|uniref:DEKNAAC102843 n=1 Tax=Brettanomyces naardenensis TaxID=13370 RepID=A0A448YLT3_BRENA|nr:DEKNAAC102843 [Brettanomyces naardenensis]
MLSSHLRRVLVNRSYIAFNRHASSYSAALEAANKLVNPQPKKIINDPFALVSEEMKSMVKSIGALIGSGHPTLNRVASYYFEAKGKNVRPLIVLLVSKSLAEIPIEERTRIAINSSDINDQEEFKGVSSAMSFAGADPEHSITPLRILYGINPKMILNPLSKPFEQSVDVKRLDEENGILPRQRRLAEITEIIHTSSLLHDDVIDIADSRRGRPSGNIAFTNKMSILAGDFLLARASVALSRLRNNEVTELMSTAIANLVEGEFMQLKNTVLQPHLNEIDNAGETKRIPEPTGRVPLKVPEYTLQQPVSISHEENVSAAFEYYLHKTYLKTASLMSKSARSAAVLSGCNDELIDHCYNFGRNLGLCFQIVDDMLDYTTNEEILGKPAGADLKLGLATAPVLYAWQIKPEIGPLIARKFSEPGDIEIARAAVVEADGVSKTKKLAEKYRDAALEHLRCLPESDSRSALEFLANAVVTRSK